MVFRLGLVLGAASMCRGFLVRRGRPELAPNALHVAAEKGDVATVEKLLGQDSGNLVNLVVNVDGDVPLHFAAKGGCVRAVELLLERRLLLDEDAEVTPLHLDPRNSKKVTPLHLAAAEGHVDVVRFLLKKGAAVYAADNSGKTALHFAAEGGHVGVAGLLLESAAVHTADNSGNTALHFAAKGGFVPVVELLLGRKPEVNAKNVNDLTAFQLAAAEGHVEVVRLLLQWGAVDEAGNADEVLQLAAREGDEGAVRLSLNRGANPNKKDEHYPWMTPFHSAVREGHVGVVRLLLAGGADLKLDWFGTMPLDFTRRLGGTKDVEALLLEALANGTG